MFRNTQIKNKYFQPNFWQEMTNGTLLHPALAVLCEPDSVEGGSQFEIAFFWPFNQA